MLWGYETLGTRVSCYDWATIENFCGFGWRIHGFQCLSFHHFGGLKMRFQLCREILDSRTTGFKTGTPRDLGKLKLRFFKCLRRWNQRYLDFVALLFCILKAWKNDSSIVLRLSAQIYAATGCRIIFILVSWKYDSLTVVRSSTQAYMASPESV